MTDGATDRDLSGSLATVRRFAALSGPFRPSTALEVAAVSTRVVRALVASGLAEACQTGLGPDGTFWLMRGSERQRQLAPLDEAGLSREAAWRRTVAPLDEDAEELLEVLTGSGRYAADVLGPRLSEVVGRVTEADRPWLERASDVLTWAGGSTAVPDSLDLVRAALARLDDARRGAEVTQRPFVGREEDVTALADWLGRPAAGPPVTALFVSGLPGVGKSTLLDRALAAVYPGEGKPFVIRLDFDRPSLDILDQAGLTGEVGRQIGNQLPQAAADLKRLRSEAARTDRGVPVKGERPDGPDDALLSYCGALVRGENCPVVVVLDTLEVLRGRGESHPGKLFAWLDGCMAHGLAPLCVIAAGRGDALDPIPDRVGRRHDLSNLSLEASERVLAQFTVPHSARPAIHSLARGNPLLLRVAAQLETDPAAGSAGTISSSLVGDAYLHRFLLSRLDSPLLRALAQPGLVPRWISPVLLREVIAPTVGAAIPSLEEAERLVAELERQAWLVRRQPGTEWLRQDAGMRVVLLPLLYADDPESCARLDRAAAAWFERRPETLWRAEGLYHRLQATRVGDPLPAVPSELSSLFDASTLAELPEAAREAVARSRGERSPPFRTAGLAMAESVDLRAVDDLRLMIEKSDWTEASLVYDQAIRRRSLDPASPAADPVRSFLWRVGRWSEARRSLRSRDAVAPDDRDLPGLHPIDALARLEMRAEFTPLGLMRQFGGGRASAPPSGSLSSDALGFVLSGSAGGDLRSGALGFVLAVAAPKLAARSSLSDETDSVQAALALWARGPKRVLTQALQVAGDRRAAWGLPRPPMLDPEPLGPGQSRPAPSGPLPDGLRSDDLVRITGALAALTPYAGPMRQILRLNQDGRLAEHAAAVLERLRDLGPPFVEYPERTGPGDAFMALQALGLAAEWAHAAGVVLENQDLRLIARRAELWRRTVAGRWSYFVPRPKRWSDFEDWHIAELLYDPWLWSAFRNWSRLDATATLQLYQLQSHADRETASRHLLLPWTGERVDGNLSVFAPTDAEIFDRNRGPRPPLETASLLRRRLPSAFAMPAAILASVRSDRGRPSAARSGPALADRVLPSPPPTDPQRNFAMAANRTPSSPPMPRGRGHAESLERLQQNLLKPGGIGEAAAKVIQADPGDLDRFGVTQEQVLNAMGQRGQALEAAIPPAALEAIIR
ncbi:AAA family ATPase, partial [Methylorubrum podarium]|uniref:AAA family ATPase n=1 Tax=Methylorubrum podarium TaxID=200476 RepID=UPI001EE239C2